MAREFPLGHRNQGDVAEVTLSGNAVNVLLVDSVNLSAYKRGAQYQYYGGHYTQSPVHLSVPHSGVWHVVVDHGGYRGHTTASVRVLPRG